MKKLLVSAVLIAGIVFGVDAAPQRRTGAVAQNATSGSTGSVSARGATSSARSATSQTKMVSARSAVSQPKTVSARAATTQKVINSGTKVSGAAKNTAVNEECQNKYFGCMDAFCMLDNVNGGRCMCSDRNAELDLVLAEIEKLDQQSYQMATFGVEQIEMGDNAEAAIAKANAAAESVTNSQNSSKKVRAALDLSMWDNPIEVDDDDVFNTTAQYDIAGKTGDALHRAASELCVAQIPECSAESSVLQLLYIQKIKSDCSAYENSLKQQRNASQTKLSTAQRALREAALEQLQNSNRYDLGQCTVEFRKCMQTTAGCGDDFSSCAVVSAMDNTNVNKSNSDKKSKNYAIQGTVTTIEISASTYDTLLAKKPLCENVTKSCTLVADKVWETFLREVAPAVKSAELIAEDNARQDCIGNISQCFQKACKDNIDPKDPEGSYDMCLTRPGTLLNLCKVPLNACGIDATSQATAEKSDIWEYVVARLAYMRVDSCTNAVKSCLQSDDRCGKDYTQCIGLDTDTIMHMCPYEKLLACQNKYGDKDIRDKAVYDEIANMVQGVMLNIDNNMFVQCQKAADEAMIKVCGDTENCDSLGVDNGAGTRSFKYEICQYTNVTGENQITWGGKCYDSLDAIDEAQLKNPGEGIMGWAGKLSGTMYWGDITYNCKQNDKGVSECAFTTEEEYKAKLKAAGYEIDEEQAKIISDRIYGMEIRALTNAVDNAINTIESDPTVQFCMTGRRVQGMTRSDGTDTSFGKRGADTARFPNLTLQMRQKIASSALKTARENYNKKYDTETMRMMQDQVKGAARIDKEKAVTAARNVCKLWADSSVLPKSEAPKAESNAGKWFGAILLAAVAVVATVITWGAAAPLAAGGIAAVVSGSVGTAVVAGAVAIGTAIGAANMFNEASEETVGEAHVDQWNYKETVVTSFAPSTGVCTKVRTYQNCETVKSNYCKYWADPKEIRDEVNLL